MTYLAITVGEIEGRRDAAVVRLQGSIDLQSVIDLQNQLGRLVEAGRPHIVLDMEDVRYINSTGLGCLINVSDLLNDRSGSIRIVGLQPKVKSVFQMLGLQNFFQVHVTVGEAAAALKRYDAAGPPAAPAISLISPPATAEPAPAVRPPDKTPVMPAPRTAAPAGMECPSCRSPLRLPGPGEYRCPRCQARVRMTEDGALTAAPPTGFVPIQASLPFTDGAIQGWAEMVRVQCSAWGAPVERAREIAADVRGLIGDLHRARGSGAGDLFHVILIRRPGGMEMRWADAGRTLSDAARGSIRSMWAARFGRIELKPHPRSGNIAVVVRNWA